MTEQPNKTLLTAPGGVLTLSQTGRAEDVTRALLVSAIREGWIVLLVNFNAAIFFGVILLASGFDAAQTLVFLSIQIVATSLTILLWFYLMARSDAEISSQYNRMRLLAQLGDAIIMAGWGGATVLLHDTENFDRTVTLIVLLMAAGISSAALSAKLVAVLVGGRIVLFLPSLVLLFLAQPPLWGINSGILVFGFLMSIGVGYAVHIQHLRVANLNLDLTETGEALAASLRAENRAVERSLSDAALREKFLRSVTHDLRQPIAALRLFNDEISRQAPEGPLLNIAQSGLRCIRSANAIIDSVAQLAWVGDAMPEQRTSRFDLAAMLGQLADEVAPLAAEKGLGFRAGIEPLHCKADPLFVERAVRNLLQNALQYTADGGIVLSARGRPEIGMVDVRVSDSGQGIAPDARHSIFLAYHQLPGDRRSHPGSLGLGLSIVKDLAARSGGMVRVASKPGMGSIFTLRLPAG